MKFTSFTLAAAAAAVATAEYTRCALDEPAESIVAELNEAARIGTANLEVSRQAAASIPVPYRAEPDSAARAESHRRVVLGLGNLQARGVRSTVLSALPMKGR